MMGNNQGKYLYKQGQERGGKRVHRLSLSSNKGAKICQRWNNKGSNSNSKNSLRLLGVGIIGKGPIKSLTISKKSRNSLIQRLNVT